jgi:hypothetical protein
MKKLLLFVVLCAVATVFATPVTKDEAAVVCRNFLAQKVANGQISNADFYYYKTEFWDNTPVYHIFKMAETGFVTIAASNHFEPVIGYSFESDYLPNPASTFIMEAYSRWIVECEKEDVSYKGAREKWQSYLSDDFTPEPTRNTTVGPLVTTKWSQETFYNALCPWDSHGPDQHVVTGCVATAMSQIMNYHGHPRSGLRGSSYIPAPYGRITIMFRDYTYNYNANPNRPTGYSNEMAKLMFHCGVAVQMGYTPTGSGAHSVDAMEAMSNHFKYDSAWLCERGLFNEIEEWRSALRSDLNKLRPLYYSANDGQGGHAFILDGYDEDGKFHINWGWGGSYDGYFVVVDNYQEDDEYNPGHNMGYTLGMSAGRLIFPVTDAPGVCSGHQRNTASSGTIRSGEPTKLYAADADCSWMLAAPEVSRYNLTFDRLETEEGADIVTIYNGPTVESGVAGTFSGTTLPTDVLHIDADSVLVTFTSNGENQMHGFQISYTTVGAGQYCSESENITTEGVFDITDGSGDANYRNNSVCTWNIKPTGMHHCFFSFPMMRLGEGDFVEIYDATTSPATLLYRYDNRNYPAQDVLTLNKSKLKVRFVADNWDVSDGFHFTAQTVTAVNDYAGVNDLSVFPNPATDRLNISFVMEDENPVFCKILDMTGKLLYNKSIESTGGLIEESVNVSEFAKGIYLLRIETSKGTTIEKFVKE